MFREKEIREGKMTQFFLVFVLCLFGLVLVIAVCVLFLMEMYVT